MRPCPNCAWMLKETDSACTMCGAAVPGAAPPPPAPGGAGAYAPPGPSGYGAGGIAPPPPVTSYSAPSPAASPGYGAQQPSSYPPLQQGSGAYGAPPPPPAAASGPVAFSSGNEAAFAVSPWARAAPAAPPAAPPPAVQQLGAPTPAGVPQMGAALGGLGAAPVPMAAPPMPGAPSMGSLSAPPMFGAPPPVPAAGQLLGGVAPPPLVSGGVVGGVQVRPPPPVGPPVVPGGVAPPMMVTPPPMLTGLSGGAPAPPALAPQGMAAHAAVAHVMGIPSGLRVLVGFLVTFQNDPGGNFWPLYSGRTQMGRAVAEGGPDIVLSDASASSRHASIHADPSTGQGFIEDEGSRNGSFLNEQRLQQGERRQLRDNDRLRLGSTTFVVKLLVS